MTTTVIVPTYDHGPTLRFSVGSALLQDDPDVEVVIIGDGAPDITRDIVGELQASDARVHFVDLPKGERHGEGYRNDVIREHATGDVVCYLSDDDIWLGDHVSSMRSLLENADFAHALPVYADPSGALHILRCDLSDARYRSHMANVANRIPLSCGAHTVEAFDRLPLGWHVPDDGIPSDYAMWRQFVRDADMRLASGFRPTVLVLPSSLRLGWSPDERTAELSRWSDRVRRTDGRDELLHVLGNSFARDAIELETSLWAAIDVAAGQRDEYQRQLLETQSTLWWQLHDRIAEHRTTASAARAAGGLARAVKRAFRR